MKFSTIFVTGGAGYVGSALIPKLLAKGYHVRLLDLLLYGSDFLPSHPHLKVIKGDIRDQELLKRELPGSDALIHLACISNDPSFELDSKLGRSINFEAFTPLVRMSKAAGVSRFVYASSSSVYGIKEERNVTEELALEPLTDYSRYKALCEELLLLEREAYFIPLVIRPATVCGYAKRLRLDVCVNLLASQAYAKGKITIFGGAQLRPNIHVEDMSDLYVKSLEWEDEAIDGKIYNAGYQNLSIQEIAELIQERSSREIEMVVTPTDDRRSYHISSEKIERELGFRPSWTVADAIDGLFSAFDEGRVPNMEEDRRYYNIKTMQEMALT